jgi:Fe-S cluster assembly protein SufB
MQSDTVQSQKDELSEMLKRPYKYGFSTEIEQNLLPKGLNESTIRSISLKKKEPEWLLDFRLRAYRKWLNMEEPSWSDNQ